jgi:hypothetical protein
MEVMEPHLLTVSKLRTRSAMKRPIIPKTPPLAPCTVEQPFSKAALKKLPAKGVYSCLHVKEKA